jgi:thiamine-monophosphate kinase
MANSWSSRPTVADLGEQAVLARILPLLPQGDGVVVGPGDDAAVVTWLPPALVTTCDLLIEGPDFCRDWSTGFDIGWKAMASNLADVAAMGAVARGVIIGLAVPDTTGVAAVEDIARGVSAGLEQMAPGCGVWGGDLSSAQEVMITVTVVGDLEGRPAITRAGAQPGDRVTVAGDVGESSRGLAALVQAGNDPEAVAALVHQSPQVRAHLRPTPPLAAGVVAACGGASAMMDISDGLLLDARRMATASGVWIDIDADTVTDAHALTGGEDHGMLACFPPTAPIPDEFRIIGQVRGADGHPGRVTVGGRDPEVTLAGWDPYRRGDR